MAHDFQPCGGANGCAAHVGVARHHNRTAVYTPPPLQGDLWSELPCMLINTSQYAAGDLFCCLPTPPPPDSAAFFNAPFDEHTFNPDYGFTSFDNIFWAMLVVYRSITVEDWPVILQLISDGASTAWAVRMVVPIPNLVA